MSRYNLARLGGLAAVLGGVLSATINTLNLVLILTMGRPLEAFAFGPLFALLELVEIAIVFFFAVGLTGLYALLGRRSRLGLSGLLLAYASVLASLSFIVFAISYIAYQMVADTDGLVRNPWVVFPENALDLAQALMLGGGVLLLGAASFGARVLGRLRVLPLLLASLIVVLPLLRLALYLLPAGAPWVLFLFGSLAILRGLCWMLLGGVLWAFASREEAARDMPAERSGR